jgi:hypothetical protein
MVITSSSAGRYRSRDADYPNIPNAARVFLESSHESEDDTPQLFAVDRLNQRIGPAKMKKEQHCTFVVPSPP